MEELIKNSIPKSKIQDKIDELKKNICIYCDGECVKIGGKTCREQ